MYRAEFHALGAGVIRFLKGGQTGMSLKRNSSESAIRLIRRQQLNFEFPLTNPKTLACERTRTNELKIHSPLTCQCATVTTLSNIRMMSITLVDNMSKTSCACFELHHELQAKYICPNLDNTIPNQWANFE